MATVTVQKWKQFGNTHSKEAADRIGIVQGPKLNYMLLRTKNHYAETKKAAKVL